jgi:hypothetical protein
MKRSPVPGGLVTRRGFAQSAPFPTHGAAPRSPTSAASRAAFWPRPQRLRRRQGSLVRDLDATLDRHQHQLLCLSAPRSC